MDRLKIIEINGKTASRHEDWCGDNFEFAKYLQTWGEVGMVKLKDKRLGEIPD